MATVNDLPAILRQRAGFEVVSLQPSDHQIRLVGRVPLNAAQQWAVIAHHLLVISEKSPWKVDISRNYFLRDQPGGQKKMFYSWRLIFQASPVQQHLPSILDAIQNSPRTSHTELQEFPLAGASRNYTNGKGAFTAETAPMAAHAVSVLKMGGGR